MCPVTKFESRHVVDDNHYFCKNLQIPIKIIHNHGYTALTPQIKTSINTTIIEYQGISVGLHKFWYKMTLSFEGHLLLMIVIIFVWNKQAPAYMKRTASDLNNYWYNNNWISGDFFRYFTKYVQDDLVFWRSFIVVDRDYICGNLCPKFAQDDLIFWRSFIVDDRDDICGNQQARDCDYICMKSCLLLPQFDTTIIENLGIFLVFHKIYARWPCLLKDVYCYWSWLYLWKSLPKIRSRWTCLLKVIYCWWSCLPQQKLNM